MVFATIMIGALITLSGSGAVLLSKDPGTVLLMIAGLVLMGLGWWSGRPGKQALAGHLAVVLTFVLMVFTAHATKQVVMLLAGADVARPAAVVATSVTGILCLVHVTLSIRWFLARKRSESA